MVPLGTLGKLQPMVGPEYVSHYNIYGSALINGAPAPGYSSGQAIAAMQRAAAEALPADFGYEWTGITYQQLKAGCGRGESCSCSRWSSCSCSSRRSTRAGRCPSW